MITGSQKVIAPVGATPNTAITAVVDRLERAGHVSRVRDDADRRKVFLQYGPGGRALADEFIGPLERRSDAVIDQFTPDELDAIRRYLTITAAAMTVHRESLTPPPTNSPTAAGPPGRAPSA